MVWRMRALLAGLGVCATLGAPVAAESLRDAVRAAVTENPDAKVREAEARATAFDLLARERDFLPTVTASAEAGVYYYNDPARLSPANNNRVSAAARANVEAAYVVFDGFRRANELYRDAARVDETVFRLLDASETLALSAVEAYIDVLRHQQLVAVSRQNVARHRDISGRVADLVEGGRLPSSDRFDAERRVMSARLALVQVEEALRSSQARYEAIVGHAPHGPMKIEWVHDLPLTGEAFTARAVRRSLSVKAADAGVKQAEYGVEVTESGRLPQVTARVGANAGLNGNGVPGAAYDAYAAVGAEWEIFAGGRKAETRAAKMRIVQAMAERDEAMLDTRELAATTWYAYNANIERTVLLDRQLAASRRAADQYYTQFEAGTRSLLEVLDAEATWFNARFEDISAEASYAFNQYQILAVESRLAEHFGIKNAGTALMPDFEARAVENGPRSVFATEIPDLK